MVAKLLGVLIASLALLIPGANALTLVTNSIDFQNAQGAIDYWEGRGLQVNRITAQDYKQNHLPGVTVILGGPDAPEGIGEIVQEFLEQEEQEEVRRDEGMFIKNEDSRTIVVFAGANRNLTREVLQKNKNIVFNLDNESDRKISEEGEENFTLSLSIPQKVEPNKTLRMFLKARKSPGIGALQLSVAYDPQELQILEVGKGELAGSALFSKYIDRKKGRINMGFVSIEGIRGTGNLAEIKAVNRGYTLKAKIYISEVTDTNGRAVFPHAEGLRVE